MRSGTFLNHLNHLRSPSHLRAARLRLAGLIGAWIVLAALLPAAPADGAMTDPLSDCCWANGTPGCDDADCEALICHQDPFCCEVKWDAICADAAQNQCEVCGVPTSNCCSANGTPGCDNATCEEVVCGSTPSCCEEEWDETCASIAASWCVTCNANYYSNPACSLATGDCCRPNDTPGCEDEICCLIVCDYDPFCCDVMWDDLCAGIAVQACEVPASPCGESDCHNPESGTCCAANSSPGCHDPDCCFNICFYDVTCCTSEWNVYCAAAANVYCSSCRIVCPGDLNDDDVVNVQDLLILIENWGPCDEPDDCPADLDDDGTVNVQDLLILVNNWGSCAN